MITTRTSVCILRCLRGATPVRCFRKAMKIAASAQDVAQFPDNALAIHQEEEEPMPQRVNNLRLLVVPDNRSRYRSILMDCDSALSPFPVFLNASIQRCNPAPTASSTTSNPRARKAQAAEVRAAVPAT